MQNYIRLGGSVDNEHAQQIRALFEKYYSNLIAVVALEQQGNYGKTVHVSAKVNLAGMNKRALQFYSFDSKSNKFLPLNPQPRYYLDEKKFLHFDTYFAGDIVITDSPLSQRGGFQSQLDKAF